MTIRLALARSGPALAAALAVVVLAACSGSSGGGDATSPAPATGAPATGAPSASTGASAGVAGPTLSPTGTIGPLSASSDVPSILATAKAALLAADSVLYSSTLANASGSTSETLIQVDKDGTCMGTVTTDAGVTGIRISGTQMWITGPTSYWSQQLQLSPSSAAMVAGKWVQTITADASFASFSFAASIPGIAEQLFSGTADAALTNVGASTVGGQPAVGVSDGAGSILYVSLTAPYRPLQVGPDPTTPQASGASGTVALSEWGEPVPFEAPPADQTIPWTSVPR